MTTTNTLLASNASLDQSVHLAKPIAVSDQEFVLFQRLVEQQMGVFLPSHKKPLLTSRLNKRLVANNCSNFSQYYKILVDKAQTHELQLALELITTNETYFFREPKHFAFLREKILPQHDRQKVFKVWSAACSSGEETYSIAMSLQEYCPSPWSLLGTDINTQMLERARKGIFVNDRAQHIPLELKHKYCNRGIGEFEGYIRIAPKLRSLVHFSQLNLMTDLTQMDNCDLIFLRNVMIYFERNTQADVIARISHSLKPGGYLFTGHSESLHGISHDLQIVQPAVYRKRS